MEERMKVYCETCNTIRNQNRRASLVCRKCRSTTRKVSKFEARSIHLRSLGFSDYREYLTSDLWAEIRSRILMRDNHACCRCNGRATQVHHRSYEPSVLRGENDR